MGSRMFISGQSSPEQTVSHGSTCPGEGWRGNAQACGLNWLGIQSSVTIETHPEFVLVLGTGKERVQRVVRVEKWRAQGRGSRRKKLWRPCARREKGAPCWEAGGSSDGARGD